MDSQLSRLLEAFGGIYCSIHLSRGDFPDDEVLLAISEESSTTRSTTNAVRNKLLLNVVDRTDADRQPTSNFAHREVLVEQRDGVLDESRRKLVHGYSGVTSGTTNK
jgi:hypothetical protein